MSKPTINYQNLCVDLLDAIGTALYLMEVRQDFAAACAVLHDARECSAKTYLSAHGPVYDGTQPIEI